jgi:hypothetical protein
VSERRANARSLAYKDGYAHGRDDGEAFGRDKCRQQLKKYEGLREATQMAPGKDRRVAIREALRALEEEEE